MANTFQRVLYFFSAASPIGIAFSVVLFVQKNYIILPIVLLIVYVPLFCQFCISVN